MNHYIIKSKINFFSNNIKMTIFDYDKYSDRFMEQTNNESIGLDIISKCLVKDKCWEPFQTEITKEILDNYNGIFIDIGCRCRI